MKKFTLLVLFLAIHLGLSAKIRLPELFSDNMVLQQQSKVAFWGSAEPNARISITTSWNKKTYTALSDGKGNFRVSLQTPSAGGPYNIVLKTTESLTLKNVLIGEVWVCSGQSNMGMMIKGNVNQPVLNSNDILMDAENPNIRLFKVNSARSATELNTLEGSSWKEASALSVRDFSAVAYLYAKILNKKLNVPVGVIMTTVGGTKIEAWMSKESLADFPQKKIVAYEKGAKVTSNSPTVLFNAMVNPLIGYGIKGVIWYQGEGNRFDHEYYDKLMVALVADWRKKWNIGDWPFYYAQIAPFRYNKSESEMVPRLREAQSRALKVIPNSGMIVSMDAGNESTIHPPDKETISKRMAYWALSKTYGKEGISYQSPTYKAMKISSDSVYVSFDNCVNGMTSFDREIKAFEIAGADNVFYPANATLLPKVGVLLTSKDVKQPVNIRYGFKDWIVGDVYNTEGLPVDPFRTDSLPVKK